MRKLASIQVVKAVDPIPGADAIDVAQVLGWRLVCRKGEFKPGDTCCYVETDAILPDRPEFAFLKPRGLRIKTIRLKGQVSQGIAFPLAILPVGTYNEGDDVTDILGVTKYEPVIPACLSGLIKGAFPKFVPKTDEVRVQVLQDLLNKYKYTNCYITEKLDGSSCTAYLNQGQFGVCSRNLELLEDDKNSFWKICREQNVEKSLRELGRNLVLQGELIGGSIQDNKLKMIGQTIRWYNCFAIDTERYLDYSEFIRTLESLGLQSVPIISCAYQLDTSIDALIALATRKSVVQQDPTDMSDKPRDVWAEGIVIRPLIEKIDIVYGVYGRVSFKVINPEFLIKYGA